MVTATIFEWARQRRGAALVEFALVVILLLTIVLGIIEFGVIAMDQLTVTQGAREGSRAASLGRPVADIAARVRGSAGLLEENRIQVSMLYSTDNGVSYPYTLGDRSGENNAPPGSLVKIECQYPHRMLTGDFFSWWSNVHNRELTLHTSVIMRRE